ncbi:TpgX protein [Staphylococcus pasteuri]|uniref:TpgX protein n=1 Tax=Staphylococcus pasteuri TaxID=45972 RepID=UPI001E432E5B|nr:TpgX protein [Staphylococcus pasteuri]MCE3022369.1 TpgX protein [Staphylococcus pasteuri]
MKKLYTSLLALSLLLGAAACSNDDSNKDKDSSKDESSKTEQKDKKSNDHSKDKTSNKDDQSNSKESKDDQNDDQNNTSDNDSTGQNQDDNSENDSNQQAKSTDNSTQQSNNINYANTYNNNSNQTASNTNNQKTSNQSSQSTQSTSGYVAPYQSENATSVARNLSKSNVNESTALKQLPNFQTALDLARQEANLYGSSNKTYNDYAIEGENANYRYVFSFKDPQHNGVYSIVTVNSQGEPVVVDPAYGK